MSEFNGWEKTRIELGKGGQGRVTLVRRPDAASHRSKCPEVIRQQISLMTMSGPSTDEQLVAAGVLAKAVSRFTAPDNPDDVGALKEFFIDGDGNEARKAEHRLEQEIAALRELVDEPGILRLIDADAGERWMITECHHGTLAKERERYKGDVLRALEAFRPLVSVVAALHKQGIIHRDIKPNNIFVSREGDLVLGDFGIVFYANADATRLTSTFGEKVGTTDWMAPWARVKRRIEEVVPSFDVFPLGKVLWSMVSGQSDLPFWWWERDDYNLQRLFPEEPQMSFVNDILRTSVVDKEADCLSTAGELLRVVDGILPAVRGGGQPIGEHLSRRCLVCGRGHYIALYDKKRRRLALVPEDGISGEPTARQVFNDDDFTLSMRTFRCDICGHVQLFHFPRGLPPLLWRG